MYPVELEINANFHVFNEGIRVETLSIFNNHHHFILI